MSKKKDNDRIIMRAEDYVNNRGFGGTMRADDYVALSQQRQEATRRRAEQERERKRRQQEQQQNKVNKPTYYYSAGGGGGKPTGQRTGAVGGGGGVPANQRKTNDFRASFDWKYGQGAYDEYLKDKRKNRLERKDSILEHAKKIKSTATGTQATPDLGISTKESYDYKYGKGAYDALQAERQNQRLKRMEETLHPTATQQTQKETQKQDETPWDALRSNVIRQIGTYPMTERPDDYNDYSEGYDRQLYDFYYGKGMHDRIMQHGTYEDKVRMMGQLRELWGDIDSGAVANVDRYVREKETNRNVTTPEAAKTAQERRLTQMENRLHPESFRKETPEELWVRASDPKNWMVGETAQQNGGQRDMTPYEIYGASDIDKRAEAAKEQLELGNYQKYLRSNGFTKWDDLPKDETFWQNVGTSSENYTGMIGEIQDETWNLITSPTILQTKTLPMNLLERPEDYNDHSEEYDRELYDTYFGEGMHDRVMQNGTYENKVMMFEKIRELWHDIDSGAVARVAELNDKLRAQEGKYDYQNAMGRAADDHLKEIEHEKGQKAKYDRLAAEFATHPSSPEFNPEYDRGGTAYGNMTELEKGVHTNDVHRIYSFLGGGKEFESWRTGEKPPVTNEYSYAMMMSDGYDEHGNYDESRDERGKFMSLYNEAMKEGREPTEAQAYLEGLLSTNALQSRYEEAEKIYTAEAVRQAPVSSNILAIGARQASGFMAIPRAIAGLFDESVKNPNSAWWGATKAAKMITDESEKQITERYGELAGKVYRAFGESVNDVLTGLLSSGMGGGSELFQRIFSYTNFVAQVAQETTFENMDKMDYESASMLGWLNGLSEYLEEKAPFETMLGSQSKGLGKAILESIVSNAAEEGYGGTILEKIKGWITGRDTEQQRADEIIAQRGYEDKNGNWVALDVDNDPGGAIHQANLKASAEYIQSVMEGIVAGGLGGGFGGTYGTIANALGLQSTGRKINSNQNTSAEGVTGGAQLVEAAAGMTGTESQKMANEILEAQKNGKKPSNYTIGKLAATMVDETSEQMGNIVKTTVENRVTSQLREKGLTGERLKEAAGAITRGLAGEKMTRADLQTIARDAEAIDLWKSYNSALSENATGLVKEVNEATKGTRSVANLVGELAGTTGTATSAIADEVNRSNQEADTVEGAIDNLAARRGELMSSEYAETAKAVAKGVTNQKYFLDDAVKIRMAAFSLAQEMPKTRIDSEAAQTLWKAAQEEFQKADAERIKNQAAIVPGKGKTSFEGAEYGTDEWNQKVNGAKIGGRLKLQMNVIADIAQKMGNTVNFVYDNRIERMSGGSVFNHAFVHGYENGSGAITINVAGLRRSGMSKNMLATLAHEMTHWLEQNSNEGYVALRQFVVDKLGAENVQKRLVNIIDNQAAVLTEESGDRLNLNGAMAELVAQSSEGLFSSKAMRDALAEENPTLFNQVKKFVRQFLARLDAAIKDLDPSLSDEARQLNQWKEDIAKLWLSARNEALGREAGGTEAGEDVSFSVAKATDKENYDYNNLIQKPDMSITLMDDISDEDIRIENEKSTRDFSKDVISIVRNSNNGSNEIYNTDTEKDIQIVANSIKHSIGRNLQKAYIQISRNIVPILKNAVAVNELEARNGKTNGSVILIGMAENSDSYYAVRFVVDNRTWKADSYDILYSISKSEIKKDGSVIKTPGLRAKGPDSGTPSTITIAGMLNLVKNAENIAAVLSEDVANQLKISRPFVKGISEGLKYSVEQLDEAYRDAVEREDWKAAEQMLLDKMQHTEGITGYNAPYFYTGEHQDIAKLIKSGDQAIIQAVVQDMAPKVPENAVLIPMPPHEGKVLESTDTMILARALSEATGRPVINALESDFHESRYAAKAAGKRNVNAKSMGFRKIAEIPEGTMPVFIDNMVGGGQTAIAAKNAIGRGITLAYAQSARSKSKGVKFTSVTYDNNGNLIPLSQRMDPNNPSWKYSVEQLGQDYMADVKDGNMQAAQDAVDAYAAEKGYTIHAYHGTGRADRVGNVFLPERATSGPMAYFTDSKDIATNYSRDKKDTSISYDDEYGDYYNQFRIKTKSGKTVPVGKLWGTLSFAERQKITEAAKHITLDEDAEEIIWDENNQHGIGNFTDYERKLHGWNSIDTLIDGWLEGGTLWDREGDFLKVLEMAGIKDAIWMNPDYREEKVYDTYLKIQKPFDTSTMYTEEFIDGMEKWWQKQDQSKYVRDSMGADFWDKNNTTVDEFIEHARYEIPLGNTNNWTRIPDGVTDYLKSLGYDGIKDQGGKGGGESHTVWIPFTSEQIKSAEAVTYDDRGNVIPLEDRFNEQEKDIRFSVAQPDMEVTTFMQGLNENALSTEQERVMFRQWKDLKANWDLYRHAYDERTRKLQALEAKENPTAYDREEMRRLRNMISNSEKKLAETEAKMVKATTQKGFAKIMSENEGIMRNLVSGKTSEQVRATIDALTKDVDRITKEMDAREKEINRLKEDITFRKQSSLVNQSKAEKMATQLRKEYGSSIDRTELIRSMIEIRLKMMRGLNINEDVEDLAWRVAAGTKGEGNVILNLMRGRTIVLGKTQLAELKGKGSSLKEVRSALAGTGIKVKTGETGTLDADWSEWCDIVPSLNRNANSGDQLDEILDVVADAKSHISGEDMFKDNIDDVVMDLKASIASIEVNAPTDPAAMKILTRMNTLVNEMAEGVTKSAEELRQTRETLAKLVDSGRMAINMTDRMQQDIDTSIKYNNALAVQSEAATWKSERWKLIEQLKSENTQKMLEEQMKWREKIAKDKKARDMMATNQQLRRQIHTNVTRLRKLLVNETDLKNIPEHMKSLTREVLGMIVKNDLIGRKITGISKQDLQELARVLGVMSSQDGAFTLDDLRLIADEEAQSVVADALADLEDGIGFYNASTKGGTILSNLQGFHNALERISEAVATITNVIHAEQEISFGDRRILVADAAEEVAHDMQQSKRKGELQGTGSRQIKTVTRAVGWGNLTPVYFFKNLKNRGMEQQWKELERAENRNGLELQKANAYIAEVAEKAGYKDWAGKKMTVKIGARNFDITVDQAMALYAVWKREKTSNPEMSNHLQNGGVFFQEEENTKGKLHREKTDMRPVKVSDEDVTAIYDQLTDAQKTYIDDMVRYLSNEMSELGNEASMRMYGIKKYKEPWYFPMQVWDGVKSARSDKGISGTNENRAAHKSWSKRRINKARNALVIGNFTDIAVGHIVEMINYNTVAPAIENLNKVLNYQRTEMNDPNDPYGGDVRRNIRVMFQQAYGTQALEYLETFLNDLNGGTVQDKRKTLRESALSMFKKNAVAGSLSVAAQQPLSYIRAAMMISPSALVQALNPTYYKGSHEEMMKYSGVAVIKEMGRFDMGFGASAKEYVGPDQKESIYAKVSDKLTVLPELMDRMTWTRMWSAVKIEQHKANPGMDMKSEEFLQKVAERFNEVMRATQVYDSIMVKSQNMRSQNYMMKLVTSFMAEPTVSLNVLTDAVRNVKQTGGKKILAAAGATYILSAIMQSFVKGLVGSGRSPDDDKTWLENFLNKWWTAFQSEINPFGLIPGYSDTIELLKNGELKDDALGAVGKLKTVVDTTRNIFEGKGKGWYRDVEDTVAQVAQLFTNIPAKNLMRDARAMANWVTQKPYAKRETSGAVLREQWRGTLLTADDLIGVVNSWLGEAGYLTTSKAYYQRIYDAKKAGNESRADDMIEYLQNGKGVKKETIDSGLTTIAKADSSLTVDQKAKLLTESGGNVNETWWKLDRDAYKKESGKENVSGNYYRLVDAINNNSATDINRAVKDLLAHGFTKEKIKKRLSDWKSEYLDGDSTKRRRIRDALQKAYKAIGLTPADADKLIESWTKTTKKKKKN